MAHGEATYDLLVRTDPDVVRQVLRLAKSLPHRGALDRALAQCRTCTDAERDRLTFGYLSRWADDIRRSPLDRPMAHYQLRVVVGLPSVVPIAAGRGKMEFENSLAILASPEADDQAKAVAIAWIMHIVGDLHQPLHAGMLWSFRFLKTDRGGTLGYVRASPREAPMSLHRFWDRIPSRPADDEAGARLLASQMMAKYPSAKLAELRTTRGIEGWTAESAELARASAYDGGRLEPGAQSAHARLLPPSYTVQARRISERRLALASYRLAAILKQALGDQVRHQAN